MMRHGSCGSSAPNSSPASTPRAATSTAPPIGPESYPEAAYASPASSTSTRPVGSGIETPIPQETMAAAITIGEYLIPHALIALGHRPARRGDRPCSGDHPLVPARAQDGVQGHRRPRRPLPLNASRHGTSRVGAPPARKPELRSEEAAAARTTAARETTVSDLSREPPRPHETWQRDPPRVAWLIPRATGWR